MKSLKEYINKASILGDIEDTLEYGDVAALHLEIKKFISENYEKCEVTISDKPNKDGKFEVSCQRSVSVKRSVRKTIESLTNDLFIWKFVKNEFDCRDCESLKSLEGAPEIVGRAFYCGYCKKLKSLNGFPKNCYLSHAKIT